MHTHLLLPVLLACVLSTQLPVQAQVQRPRYNTSIASKSYGFYEYLPQGYDTGNQRYPLIVFMHGYGQRGNGDSAQLPLVVQGLPKVIQAGKFPTGFTINGTTHRFIVISPQFTSWPAASQLEEVIDYAVRTYRVDQSRIYLSGYSMGGGVVWEFAGENSTNANRVAAIVPIAGSSFASAERGRVIAGANLPVWATHNSHDATVLLRKTDDYIAAVNAAPAPAPAARKTVFFSKDHDAWTKTCDPLFREDGKNIYEWMLQYQRSAPGAGSNSPVCGGSVLKLWTHDVAGATFRWTGPNGFTSAVRTPEITTVSAAVAGTYQVTITIGDSVATASTDVVVQATRKFYRDSDIDNYGSSTSRTACRAPAGYVANPGDCDNSVRSTYPGAPEKCDGKDNDCNGLIDDNPVQTTFYKDADKDGYGNGAISTVACSRPSGYVTIPGDCNDANAAVHPNAVEKCDGIDNDCNGIKEDTFTMHTYYRDWDKDGYGNQYAKKTACALPAGYVANSSDCKDGDATIYPGAPELCDGLDNDCDRKIDDGLILTTFYLDGDKDGYGGSTQKQACAAPPGYVSAGGDCNDQNAAVHPGAAEVAGNGIDDNCNGATDELLTTMEKRAGPMLTDVDATLRIYAVPNPTAGPFAIRMQGSDGSPVHAVVYNATGRVVARMRNIAVGGRLSVGDALPYGVYYLEAVQGRRVARLKLVKLPQ